MDLRSRILTAAYKHAPCSLIGDLSSAASAPTCDVSCIINFYGRIDLLEGILYSLVEQDLPRAKFEVILVEDRGGTSEGKNIAERFRSALNVDYFALPDHFGVMGYSRNIGLSRAKGKFVLFLDDDTVILQKDFLSQLVRQFQATNADGIIPLGRALYCTIKGKYSYHEPHYPTNRCMAYRRDVLFGLGGFVSSIIGQEDVEFVVRFILAGKVSVPSADLTYLHPPLLVPNFRKPQAVGHSFYRLKSRYPLLLWLLLIINCSRHAPLYLVPRRKYREMGRFGIGFILGVIVSPFKSEGFGYT
jgi:glycosyltransferase involved in cell wall biosynthesis